MKMTWGITISDAYSQVEAAGDGAMALIGVGYANTNVSHVVVMANDHGVVGIVEGQNWSNNNLTGVIVDRNLAERRYNEGGENLIGMGFIQK